MGGKASRGESGTHNTHDDIINTKAFKSADQDLFGLKCYKHD